MAKLSAKQRDSLSDSDFAVPGKRELPIHDAEHVRKAVQLFTTTKGLTPSEKTTAKRRIRAAAKKFGVKINSSTFMEATELAEVVCLEFDPTKALVAPPDPDNDDGIMRLRVPFYVGNSVARPSGWSEPLFFAADELPGIIAAANEQLRTGKQPLNVYARHSHAVTADHLPIGDVVALEREGDIGYATIEIVDDDDYGTQVQKLVKAKKLNAVSLRSTSELTLEERKVNGEVMAAPVGMKLAGIDFAPEGPAMPTFGVQVLAEVHVEPYEPTPPDDGEQEDDDNMESITLEAVRAVPAVVAELERPLRERITALEADVTAKAGELATKAGELKTAQDRVVALEAEVAKAAVDGALDELAARFPKPKRARKVLAEHCKDCTSRAQVMAEAAPLLLELFDELRASGSQSGDGDGDGAGNEPRKTPKQVLAELFSDTGRGQSQGDNGNGEGRAQTQNTNVEYAGGLPLPA